MSHFDTLKKVVAEIDSFQAHSAREMAAHGASTYRANLDSYFAAKFSILLKQLQIHAVAFAYDFGPIATSQQYSYEVAGREGPRHLVLPVHTWNRETGQFEDDPNGRAKLWTYQRCREHEVGELGADPWFIRAFRSSDEFRSDAERELDLALVREGEYSTNLLLWRLQAIYKSSGSIPERWFELKSGISLLVAGSSIVESLLKPQTSGPTLQELSSVGLCTGIGSSRTATVCEELELLGLAYRGAEGRLVGTERLLRMAQWLSHPRDETSVSPDLGRVLPDLAAARINTLGLLESPHGQPLFLDDLNLEAFLRAASEVAATAPPVEQTARFPVLSHYVNRTNEHISRCWFVFPIPFSPLALSPSEHPASAYILGTFADTIADGGGRRMLDREEFVAHLRVIRLLLGTFYQNTLGLELAARYYSVLAREEEVATLRHAVTTSLGEVAVRAKDLDLAITSQDFGGATQSIRDLRKSISRMQDRVRALRRFSAAKLKLEPCDPGQIFRDTLAAMIADGCQLLSLREVHTLVSGDASLMVFADTELLNYLFEILWRNSIEAASTCAANEALDCMIMIERARGLAGLLRLEFRDNGPGMSDEGRAALQESIRLFQPFSTKPELSGRGLLDARRIVQRHLTEAAVRLPIIAPEIEVLKPVSGKGFRLSFLLPEAKED